MQINKVQNNNLNFGMALKISPKANKALEQQSKQYLDNLAIIGKELENYPYCDLLLDENLTPSVVMLNKKIDYFKAFKEEVEMAGKQYERSAGGETEGGIYPLIPMTISDAIADSKKSKQFYEEIKNKDEISQAFELTKMLSTQKILERNKQVAIDNIMSKYADSSHFEDIQQTEKNKKSFWNLLKF